MAWITEAVGNPETGYTLVGDGDSRAAISAAVAAAKTFTTDFELNLVAGQHVRGFGSSTSANNAVFTVNTDVSFALVVNESIADQGASGAIGLSALSVDTSADDLTITLNQTGTPIVNCTNLTMSGGTLTCSTDSSITGTIALHAFVPFSFSTKWVGMVSADGAVFQFSNSTANPGIVATGGSGTLTIASVTLSTTDTGNVFDGSDSEKHVTGNIIITSPNSGTTLCGSQVGNCNFDGNVTVQAPIDAGFKGGSIIIGGNLSFNDVNDFSTYANLTVTGTATVGNVANSLMMGNTLNLNSTFNVGNVGGNLTNGGCTLNCTGNASIGAITGVFGSDGDVMTFGADLTIGPVGNDFFIGTSLVVAGDLTVGAITGFFAVNVSTISVSGVLTCPAITIVDTAILSDATIQAGSHTIDNNATLINVTISGGLYDFTHSAYYAAIAQISQGTTTTTTLTINTATPTFGTGPYTYRHQRNAANAATGWTNGGTTKNYQWTGLIAGTIYYFRTIQVDSLGQTVVSDVVSAATTGGGASPQANVASNVAANVVSNVN